MDPASLSMAFAMGWEILWPLIVPVQRNAHW